MNKVTVTTLANKKAAGEKLTCLTAYDYSFASLLDQAGIDIVMVGDSLGMVIQGHETTLPVKIDDMVYHSRCVASGVKRALIVVDLPFMTYQQGPQQAIESAGRLMQDGRAHVVKLEGGTEMAETVNFLVQRGIPVCAHIGLTPQSVHQLGGYRLQGKSPDAARQLIDDAKNLEAAGASIIVLEAIPAVLAKEISSCLTIPTIGIGAGVHCDGQVLVLQDMLGIYPGGSPKFSRNFMVNRSCIADAISAYIQAVNEGEFPNQDESC